MATVANYKGSNLCAVQNPRSSQTALILSTSGNPELWLAGAPYERPRRVTKNKSNESGPCWSPDGRRLILTSDSRGKPQLYEVSLSSGVLSRIPTNVSSHCVEAAWNPLDSSKIAFTAAVGGGFQIFEYDFSKRTSRMITRGRDHAMQPCWANDGRISFLPAGLRGELLASCSLIRNSKKLLPYLCTIVVLETVRSHLFSIIAKKFFRFISP